MNLSLSSRPRIAARAALAPKLWLLLLATLTLLTRLPLQSELLYHWDSVNFAWALAQFDVANGQPHAPGYPLYVVLGHVATWFTGGAQAGYVLLAALGSAVAVCALYDLGRLLWDDRVGLLAALLLLLSPLFWFYGEVALPHALDAAAVIVAANLSWRVWDGDRRLAPVLALWLGLIGGFRQQTLVFMFPLAVLTCSRLPWRLTLACLAVLGLTVLAWMAPLLRLSGGAAAYFGMVAGYSEHFNRTTSVFLDGGLTGLAYNLGKLARYTAWGWALAIIPAALGLWAARGSLTALPRDRRLWFLLVWAAPCLGFYTLIHMGQQGLIFVYLPILMLLSARGGTALGPRAGTLLVLLCALGNGLLFLLAPSHIGSGAMKVLALTTVREQDALLKDQIAATRAGLPAGGVLLSDEWRFPQYYLPEVPLVRYSARFLSDPSWSPELSPEEQGAIERATALAWYEPTIDAANRAPGRTALLGSNGGVQLRVIRRGPGERFRISHKGITVEQIVVAP